MSGTKGKTSGDYSGIEKPDRILDTIEKIGNALLLNILFLICSIPVFTIGASYAAFYFTMRYCVKEDNSYPAKTFYKTFKRCFKKGTVFTLIIAAAGVLFFVNRQYSFAAYTGRKAVIMISAYDVFFVLLLLFTVYVFPAVSRFDAGIKQLARIVLTAVAKRPLIALCMLVLAVGGTYLVIRLSVGFTLVVPALMCYASVFLIEKSFLPLIGKDQGSKDQ